MTLTAKAAAPVGVLLIALLAVAIGSSFMPLDRVIAALLGAGSRADGVILWNIRLPRVLLAALSGAALAVAGLLLQRATRNPLAAPSVLGIVDGAAVGVLVFFLIFSNEANALVVSVHWQPLAAIGGALVFATTVGVLAWQDAVSPLRLLLYGVAMAAFANAIVILMIIAGPVFRART
ncbi:MAG: iron chelate uptake ABC transporter family permease subunit [Pseudomonadota bacterium]